jgi:serine/threonine protein kinase
MPAIRFTKTRIWHPDVTQEIEIVEKTGEAPKEDGKIINVGQLVFTLHDIIGEGGMAIVRRATQKSINKPGDESDDIFCTVAAKRSFCKEPRLEQALIREAEINSRITHSNVVKPTYHGYHDGGYLIIMPFIKTDLEKILQHHRTIPGSKTPNQFFDTKKYLLHYATPDYNGEDWPRRMPDKMAAYFLYMVARTLAPLFKKHGIVHRDISPNNILVDPDIGAIYLADFGVAKKKGDTNIIPAGKLPYMSPESIMNPAESDHRADQYALGVMAYVMVAGLSPNDIFRQPSDLDQTNREAVNRYQLISLIEQFDRKPIPLHNIVRDVDEEFSMIVHKAMQSDPKQRYPSLEEFIKDLKKYIHKGPGPTPEGLSDYLNMHYHGARSFNREDFEMAMHNLDFLPKRDGVPDIYVPLVLTEAALTRLMHDENPARS